MEKTPVTPQLAHVSFISDGFYFICFFFLLSFVFVCALRVLICLFYQHAIGKEIKIEMGF